MTILKGKGVCGGIAFGKLEIFKKEETTVYRTRVKDTKAEIHRFEDALKKASDELRTLYKKAVEEVGEDNAMIFDIHLMMLSEADYLESIKQKRERRNRV